MPEILVGKYMKALIMAIERGKRTRAYRVTENVTGNTLGFLRWYGPWRGYCFFPVTGTVYDGGCLTQITNWLTELDATYKLSKEVPPDAHQ